ncbi:hypothetical protein bpr_I0672 [Butyrivibrio proteoclasticus B316]|jgi:hypothetical protein|uniref:DUF3021 domain-containing protein n=1 Tax=Butyrivibrio proteoclasticus (strain ATCC 51982 / DSM 14932 / B316) TaxID=515622 RepID=E0S0U2_BUTPB|nr:DUF3021 family protein [Butyrivibrio proteoclasticus]ADL33417.1 hypothetical protein bpr_I0672 [Butyrivibrio proteoclasticus B316]
MKERKRVSLWELYLTKEISIEFKACLYFFAFLFFYCMYRVIGGVYDASILHMTELILACYIIGYIQVYLLWNFDEADKLGGKEILGIALCTAVYTAISWLFNWFDKNIIATALFAAYILLVYFCVYLVYKYKRIIDDKKLNEDLKLFQTRHKSE